jgi:hypothetical protein
MFRVLVKNNLSGAINKLDMLKINIQSLMAEAVSAAEPEVKNLFDDETEIEVIPSSDGVEMGIKNYNNDMSDEVQAIILDKLRSKFKGVK